MKSEDNSYYHQIMDTHPTSKNLHGEQPTPFESNIDIGDDVDHDIETSSKKDEETVTFWIKEGGVSVQQQFSDTESEGTHFSSETNNPSKIPTELSFQQSNEDIEYFEEEPEVVDSSTVFSSGTQRYSSGNDGDTSESYHTFSSDTIQYDDRIKDDRGGGGEVVSSFPEYSQDSPEHLVQSLSEFFTKDEKELMLPPDAVFNVEDKYFVVLPNSGLPGHTLFHCLSQILTGQEEDHKEIREKIMDYICSQAGWDILGDGIVGFYQHLIDELRVSSKEIAEKFGEGNWEQFQKRVYRHYFMEQEMEGSFIELVAASILFGFKYTCIFLKEEEGSGNASCRVFHSTCENSEESNVGKMDSLTMTQLRKANKEAKQICKQKNYILRVGETPENWKWTLVVPYLHNCFRNEEGKVVSGPCTCATLSKGTFEGNLWHVYGLQWNKGTSSLERLVNVQFSWRRGISVIPTSSGKLLGGYVNLGTDLFSNLCPLIPNCLHTGNQCYLRDAVEYCPKNLTCFSFSSALSFADLILRNKEQHGSKKSRVKLKRRKEEASPKPKIGTLKDLHRASKIFDFGYCVVGIDENGLFQTLGRLDKDKTIYLLARINRRRKITEWCALEDMRVYKTCISEQSVGNLLVPGSSSSSSSSTTLNEDQRHQMSDCNSGTGLIKPAASATSYSSSRGRRGGGTPFRLRISRYFTCLRFFIARIKNRNKVRQTKFFPLNEIPTYDDKNNTVRSSVR